MKKKILLGLLAIVVVAGGVAGLSAYEAHVINVTAHIENALYVHPQAVEFGTVFPQEYLERDFTVSTSRSFQAEDNALAVTYVIKQKPKCWNNNLESPQYAPVDYATHECPVIEGLQYVEMEDLCRFLSKTDGDPSDGNDTSHPSYYVDEGPAGPSPEDHCVAPVGDATGRLDKQDLLDAWIVDLKVPPIAGYVGQDWPASCADWTVPTDSLDYGCDLWIEVTGIERALQ